MELPHGSDNDFHQLDMVNFSVQKFDCHSIQGKICLSTPPSTIAMTSSNVSRVFFMCGKEILETKC
jgi:hypothetical protein